MANSSEGEKKGKGRDQVFSFLVTSILTFVVFFIILIVVSVALKKDRREFLEKNRVVDLGYILPLAGQDYDIKPGMVGFTVRDNITGNVSWIEARFGDITYVEDPGECRVRLESDQYSRDLYDGKVGSPIEFLRKARVPGRFYVIGHDYEKYIKRYEAR